jgi:hypothetical protein
MKGDELVGSGYTTEAFVKYPEKCGAVHAAAQGDENPIFRVDELVALDGLAHETTDLSLNEGHLGGVILSPLRC